MNTGNMLRLRQAVTALRMQAARNYAQTTPPKRNVIDMTQQKILSKNPMYKVTGMSWQYLKTDYSLVPLFGFTAFACALASYYVWRLATQNIDVTWHKGNADAFEPHQKTANKQAKFLAFNQDYTKNPNAEGAALSHDLLMKMVEERKEEAEKKTAAE